MTAIREWLRLNGPLLLFITVLGAAFFFLRNTPSEHITSVAAFEQSVTAGEPVVIDFYSNF